ncbi:hypothetical protein BT67DRAFT_192502 [Trichocladium antarcticum]|uniref:Uncharacterized protein n=1 Tax=Trichocladium antarcticum TaxID=1450529 RepID=A0AAN6UQ13_9PEZI|nr:hypothetical protein BT67DRAFT_192502 [Trichocladium antarcticum]
MMRIRSILQRDAIIVLVKPSPEATSHERTSKARFCPASSDDGLGQVIGEQGARKIFVALPKQPYHDALLLHAPWSLGCIWSGTPTGFKPFPAPQNHGIRASKQTVEAPGISLCRFSRPSAACANNWHECHVLDGRRGTGGQANPRSSLTRFPSQTHRPDNLADLTRPNGWWP